MYLILTMYFETKNKCVNFDSQFSHVSFYESTGCPAPTLLKKTGFLFPLGGQNGADNVFVKCYYYF